MKNTMIAQIHSLPGLIREVAPEFDDAIRSSLNPRLCSSVQRVYLTGCGDSHFASLAAELAFESLAGIPTEAMTALQFGRYAAPFLPKGPPGNNLVIGISVSGEVSRTLEAMQQGKAAGATAISLTATPESRIARAGDAVIFTRAPNLPEPAGSTTPGIRSYTCNLLTLYLIAVRLGEARGRISSSEAKELRAVLLDLADAGERTIADNDPLASELASRWEDAGEYVISGAGPNFGTALFSAAKILEASGDFALGQDTEEWAHLQYFGRKVNTPTFFICPKGREHSRSLEVIAAARAIERRVAVIGPPSIQSSTGSIEAKLPLPEGIAEVFSPLVAFIPGGLFAAYLSEVREEPFFRNFGGGRNVEGGGGASRIRTSEILEGRA